MTDIAPTPATLALSDDGYVAPRGVWPAIRRFVRRQPVGTIGIVLVSIFGLAGIFADWLAPYNPTANDFTAMTLQDLFVAPRHNHFGKLWRKEPLQPPNPTQLLKLLCDARFQAAV